MYIDEYGFPVGDMYDNGVDFNNDFGGIPGVGYGLGYKPLKATTRNVEEMIALQLGMNPIDLEFVKLDESPVFQNWKHSCYQSGVTKMIVNQFIFEDGSNIVYAICPFFPKCNKVHFYVDRGQV